MRTPQNAYQAMGLGMMGAVEVLEDPAVSSAPGDVSKPTRFKEIDYKNSDDCHLGASNQTQGGVTILAGTALIVAGVPTSPFKPRAMVIPSYLQVNLFIRQITIGPFNAIEGDPVPAAGHSEVSLNQFVSWPTIQANSPIKFDLLNASAFDKLNVAVDIRGIRLRE